MSDADRITVIGYEGWRGHEHIGWGSAAVLMGGLLVNAVSGMGGPQTEDEIAALAATGMITLLPKRVMIPETFGACVLEAAPKAQENLGLDAGELRVEVVDGPQANFYIFTSQALFDSFRRKTADALSTRILFSMHGEEEYRGAIKIGLTLSAHHPILNALGAHFCGGSWRLAEAMLRSAEDFKAFERAREILTR